MDGPAPLGVEEVGAGPPLLAVHGAVAGGRLSFGGVAPRWGRSRRVLVVDRPGFERTPGPGEAFRAQADRLLATIDQACGGEPVDAVGHDVGGLVLLDAVERRPEAFTSLVLVEVPAVDLCPTDMVEPTRLLRAAQAAWQRAGEDLAGAVDELHAAIDPALHTALVPLLRREDPGIARLRDDLAIWGAMLDRTALAEAVSGAHPVRVLAVSGTESHPAFRTFGGCIAAALSGRHEVVDGAGHAVQLHPSFAGLLEAFLLDEGPVT